VRAVRAVRQVRDFTPGVVGGRLVPWIVAIHARVIVVVGVVGMIGVIRVIVVVCVRVRIGPARLANNVVVGVRSVVAEEGLPSERRRELPASGDRGAVPDLPGSDRLVQVVAHADVVAVLGQPHGNDRILADVGVFDLPVAREPDLDR